MNSIWSETSQISTFESLNEKIKTDVLIVGGGLAGILCLYMLKQRGISCVLVESRRICSGITKNTTAKITSQHGLIYDKLVSSVGKEKAMQYLNANNLALEEFKKICKDIDCDFEEKDSFVYTLDNPKKIEDELNALKELNFRADFVKDLSLPFATSGAIKFQNQAQFNPLKFVLEIVKGLNVYENTTVHEILDHTAITDNGRITAKKIIVATHFPFINKHGSYFLKMYQHRSYVIALNDAEDVHGMYVDEAQNGMSFRNYKGRLLIGGGDHKTGKSGGNWQELRGFAKKHYPNSKEEFYWATQDCMTLDSVPYIGNYSKNTNDLYIATGFNKWGMTSSMVSAMILSDLICGKQNENADVFNPSRSILKPQLLLNTAQALSGWLTLTEKRCPHLGCALKWNKTERSWDCPCHGSRFEKDGKLIDNPATGDLKL